MMRFRTGKRFMDDLAKALDLDPVELPITNIVISSNISAVPTATITINIQDEQTQEIVKIVQRERLGHTSDEVTGEHS